MSKHHSIHSLLDSLKQFGKLYTDFGPKHPVAANIELQPALEEVFKQYPFLQKDFDYTEFLEFYGGASYTQQKYLLSLDMFGISDEVSTHLLYGPGEPITTDGILTFCSISLAKNLENPCPTDIQGIGFGFDVTGERKQGVYRCFNSNPYHYYCNNFLQWLEKFVKNRGRLTE